jgi:hypothetical protein
MTNHILSDVEIAKEKLKPWPGSAKNRLIITSVYAVPFIVLSFITFILGGLSDVTFSPNAALLITVENLSKSGFSLTAIMTSYPPITLIYAALSSLAGSYASLVMALVGSLFAATLLVSLSAILRQKQTPQNMRTILIGLVVLSPIIYWQAIFNLPGMIGLTLLALGLSHTIRFVQWGGTYNGFVAGLLFAGAVLANNNSALMLLYLCWLL